MNVNMIRKLIDELQSEGVDLSRGIDLKDFWKNRGYGPLLLPN